MLMCLIFTLCSTLPFAYGSFADRYDVSKLPYDLEPVRWLVGHWKLKEVGGTQQVVLPPSILDFAINPLPKFGARALNLTGHYYHDPNHPELKETMYGFLPVKNATRRDPRHQTALLTSYQSGINMIEQGLVKPREQTIELHLKQFMSRSFSPGFSSSDFTIDGLERKIFVIDQQLTMEVQSITTIGQDNYRAHYFREIP